MTDRQQSLIDQMPPQMEAIRSNIPAVEEQANVKNNELALESLQLLDKCLRSLDSALSEDRLLTYPAVSLTQIIKLLTGVATATTDAAGNFDANAGNFTNQIDALHNRLWLDRLLDPNAEIAGYRKANAQLEVELKNLREKIQFIQAGVQDRERAKAAAEEAEKLKAQVATAAAESDGSKKDIDALLSSANTVHNEFSTQSEAIQKLLEGADESKTNITALEADLKKWHGEIEATRKAIESVRDSTTEKLKDYDKDIQERKALLSEYDRKINEQFKLASSGALASSFSSRGNELRRATSWWMVVALTSYIGFIAFAVWVMRETFSAAANGFDPWAFFARIIVAVPIGLLVWFVTIQFGNARRLQESYAFKGTVASSFDAYRDLIAKITKDPELKDSKEYAAFIRETIEQIYKDPPLGNKDDDNLPHGQAVKDLPNVLKSLGEFVQKVK